MLGLLFHSIFSSQLRQQPQPNNRQLHEFLNAMGNPPQLTAAVRRAERDPVRAFTTIELRINQYLAAQRAAEAEAPITPVAAPAQGPR
ncbi:hypothetical protein BH10PSE19_BH10PSE19_12090 [soil metagenome]